MNQVDRVHEYLKMHGTITLPEAANELGVWYLPSRIYEIKKRYAVKITDRFIDLKNRFGETIKVKEYRLELPTL